MTIITQNESADNSEIQKIFESISENLKCEKFIAIGNIIENLFIFDSKISEGLIEILIYLYSNKLIDEDDIKHGYNIL
jgi:hypothetical protein